VQLDLHPSGSSPEKRDESTDTYVTTVKAHTRLGEQWDLDAALVYAHSSGDADLTTTPVLALPGSADSTANTYIGELGLSYLILKDLIFHFDFRYHNIDQEERRTPIYSWALRDPRPYKRLYGDLSTGISFENLTERATRSNEDGGGPVQYSFTGGENPRTTSGTMVGSRTGNPTSSHRVWRAWGANISNSYTWFHREPSASSRSGTIR
jgi:hypothetical protein